MTYFNGLVQHSFALRLGDAYEPFDGHSTGRSIEERFKLGPCKAGKEFHVRTLDELGKGGAEDMARHSPLVEAGLTTVRARPLDFLDHDRNRGVCDPWPEVLSWATPKADGGGEDDCRRGWLRPRMFFTEYEENYDRDSESDFLIDASTSSASGQAVARALLEAVAFRRSQLFGLATANRFVNVMLPNARLRHMVGEHGSEAEPRDLILQPLLSLVRDGRDRKQFRQMYSLAFFVIPIEGEGEGGCARGMAIQEVMSNVNAGWSLASTVSEEASTRYLITDLDPLREYVTRLGTTGAQGLREPLGAPAGLSLRQVTETVAFGIAMRLTQGSSGEATRAMVRHIGDEAVTSLGTARVSAAILVDSDLNPEEIRKPIVDRDPPGSLGCLISTLASDTRTPEWTKRTRRRYQLDRPLIDEADYAIGLVPSNRCLLVTNLKKEDRCSRESLLSRVAAVTYMTLGAATAIGTMRSIDRALEGLEHEDPCKIAEIDAEIATDLHEIYDLDIARETYRQLYSRLRDRIGITQDYKALQDKMKTLYRATSTRHEEIAQKQLTRLTVAIAVVSGAISVVGILVALN